MPYTRTTWVDNTTDVTAARMNAIENGIYDITLKNNYSLLAQSIITGGGTISYTSGVFNWTARFIVIAGGRGADLATGGFFDITRPADSTVITGVGGAANKTVSSGIPLAAWEAVYYILPLGSGSTSLAANFRVANYTSDFTPPDHWIRIAGVNSDAAYLELATGQKLKAGESVTSDRAATVDGSATVPSLRTLGTTATTAAAGNDSRFPAGADIVDADISATAAIAESKLTLASDAAAGTASRRTLGTGATQAAAGNDSRFTDARTPTAHATTHKSGGTDAIRLDEFATPTATLQLPVQGTGGGLLIGTDVNLYRSATNTLATDDAFQIGTQFLGLNADTITVPSYSWAGDTNTGIYHPAEDQMIMTVGGIGVLRTSLTVAGQASSATVSIGATAPSDLYQLRLYRTLDDRDSGGTTYAIYADPIYRPNAAGAVRSYRGGAFFSRIRDTYITDATNITGSIIGLTAHTQVEDTAGTRAITAIYGALIGATSTSVGLGDVTTAYGIAVDTSNIYGNWGTWRGLYINRPVLQTGGTLTTAEGLRIEDVSLIGATTAWGLMVDGASANSRFSGKLRVGGTTVPSDTLDVTGTLATSGNATIAGTTTISGGAGSKTALNLSSTTFNTGITIGGDVNLYRVAANILSTDDSFSCGVDTTGAYRAGVILQTSGITRAGASASTGTTFQAVVAAEAWPRWTVLASGEIQWGGGAAAYDTNLYRPLNTPDTLKTDDSFVVGGALDHDGTTVGFFGVAPQTRHSSPPQARVGTAPDGLYEGSTLDNVIAWTSRIAEALQRHGLLHNVGPWSS